MSDGKLQQTDTHWYVPLITHHFYISYRLTYKKPMPKFTQITKYHCRVCNQ